MLHTHFRHIKGVVHPKVNNHILLLFQACYKNIFFFKQEKFNFKQEKSIILTHTFGYCYKYTPVT